MFISSCFTVVWTIVNKVFLNISVQIILEFGSSWAWMLKTDAYLMTKMLRILVRMRPACGARVLMVSTQTLRVEYLCKGSFAFPYIWFSFTAHAGSIHLSSAKSETNSHILEKFVIFSWKSRDKHGHLYGGWPSWAGFY